MSESEILNAVADAIMQEVNGGNSLSSSFQGRSGLLTQSMEHQLGEEAIIDKINQIFDEVAMERNEFEESYNGLSTSKPKNANDPLGISTSIQVNENSLVLPRSAQKGGKSNLDDNMQAP